MLFAPVASGFYPVFYNYSIKLLIDLFTNISYITFAQAIKPIVFFLGAQIIMDAAWRSHNFAQLKCMPYVLQTMLVKVCTHCFNLPYTYFQDNFAGAIVGKIKGIGDNYFKLHQGLEFKLSKPLLTTIFSGIALALSNIKIFCFVMGFTLVYTPTAFKFFKRLAHLEQKKQDSWYYLFGGVADSISNIFTIFSFATKKHELQKINNYYETTHNPLSIRYYKYDFVISIILALIYWAFVGALFFYVIHLKNLGEISLGDIAFVLTTTFVFAGGSWETTMELKSFLDNVAAFRAAFSIMKLPQDTIDAPDAASLKVSNPSVTFEDVSFGYGDHNHVLKNLNLRISAGEKVGIVGHSGAGKSTLVSLLLKNFKTNGGDIQIGGQSIYNVTADSVRAHVSLIPQDIMLFHRSIAENIGYAKENATEIEIECAAKAANLHDFIETLPNKYNTLVGERGVKLSGGQRQRIAIARSILKNAPILILDEATSSLDSQTEQEIQTSIAQILKDNKTTVIAIAHRLSTIKNLDRIVVLENGQIVEDGPFATLMNIKNGKFKEMWEHQVNGMVL
jgi:ATP-binding cassette subfamily B protein